MKKKTGCLLVLLVGFAVLIVAVVISIRGDLRCFESNSEAILTDLKTHLENNDWDYVVTEGEKYTLSENKELIDLVNLAKSDKKLAETSKRAKVIVDELSQKPTPEPSRLLPGIQSFLKTHSEFGTPTTTQDIPNWTEGKRQRIQFTSGRNLLFYLKDGVVVTVFEDNSEGDRKKIWTSYSGTAEYMKDTSQKSTGAIPQYTIISAINLVAGGKFADVLVPSLTRETPRDTRSEIAFAIRKKEGLRCLSMYSTREACKASYSSSYAEQHPDASNGYLGGISMNTGKFED